MLVIVTLLSLLFPFIFLFKGKATCQKEDIFISSDPGNFLWHYCKICDLSSLLKIRSKNFPKNVENCHFREKCRTRRHFHNLLISVWIRKQKKILSSCMTMVCYEFREVVHRCSKMQKARMTVDKVKIYREAFQLNFTKDFNQRSETFPFSSKF